MRPYSLLEKHFLRLHSIDHATSILGWDESVMMPVGSGEARAQALAELRVLKHELLSSPQALALLEEAQQNEHHLSAWQRSNLREMSYIIQSAKAVQKDLIAATSLANSRCEQAWRYLRAENNWRDFLPLFEKVVSLSREEAQQRSEFTGLSPYDSLLDQFNPSLTSSQVTTLFNQVIQFLPELIQTIIEHQKGFFIHPPTTEFPVEHQKSLGLEVMKILGFDFNKGRLDVSHHPFCGGVPQDVRITTRYNKSNFIESLMGVIHETGHACYEQKLPREWLGQPVGMARGMHIHESQSLLYEIYIGRNKNFLSFIKPLLVNYFSVDPKCPFFNTENLYHTINSVKRTLIRVNADEVTYPAHIILRYEIERDLISGQIKTKDIPEIWDQKMIQYLGLSTKGNYKDGCMQDMHWSAGAFGYFPSYSLGAMTSAQFFASIQKIYPHINEDIRAGHFEKIHQWLEGHIWSQGCFSSANELIENATGESLNPIHFKNHIEAKYLYDTSFK